MKVKQTPNRAPISESVSAVELTIGAMRLISSVFSTITTLDGV